jgi:dTDP-glucose 4,6-dehydratase
MVKKKNKKIIVIGSNSFSAGSLIKLLLKKGNQVIGVGRSNINKNHFLAFNNNSSNFKFIKLDINKDHKKIFFLIKTAKPLYIINYASQSMVGQSWDNPIDWFRTNSFSLVRLYYNISKLNFKFKLIHISTPEVYGSLKKNAKENELYKPSTPYAVSRVTADQFLRILFNQNKINFCSIRASNVYGEYQKLYRIVPKTIFSILNNAKFKLDGDGTSMRNFIHIDDVSLAIYKIMKKGRSGEIYHVAGNTMISIKNLVKKICNIMNYSYSNLIIKSSERKGQDKFYSLSAKKMMNEFNWEPKITLDQGLLRCINWIKNNLRYFNKNDQIYIHKK